MRTMEYRNVLFEENEGIARITVNRPDVRNAVDRATIEELLDAVERAEERESVRALILTGSGEKAFIAGADISELAAAGPIAARQIARRGQHLTHRITWLKKPVLAAIHGYALGGGCEIALACHIRVGSTTAKLGQPEVNLGVIPGFGGTQRLPRLIGPGRALEMLLTGEMIDAAEAHRIGLLNRVVEPDQLLPTCEAIARSIASRGPLAVGLTLQAVWRGLDATLTEGLLLEADSFGIAASSHDWREGTAAFLEKRKPDFQGR
ncbi:MAG: enoyl-CoA hydratase/isomerase family protein [Candidatus Eisenbacteria bacterium]